MESSVRLFIEECNSFQVRSPSRNILLKSHPCQGTTINEWYLNIWRVLVFVSHGILWRTIESTLLVFPAIGGCRTTECQLGKRLMFFTSACACHWCLCFRLFTWKKLSTMLSIFVNWTICLFWLFPYYPQKLGLKGTWILNSMFVLHARDSSSDVQLIAPWSRIVITICQQYSPPISRVQQLRFGRNPSTFELVWRDWDQIFRLKGRPETISSFSAQLNFYGPHRFCQLSGVFPVAAVSTPQTFWKHSYNFSVPRDTLVRFVLSSISLHHIS